MKLDAKQRGPIKLFFHMAKKIIIALLLWGLGFVVGDQYRVMKKRWGGPVHRIAHKVEHPEGEKAFCLLTLSYNNAAYCEKNIASILAQDYENYRVIYIDDASTDGTFERVSAMANERFTLLRNETNLGAMANYVQGMAQIKDDEIVVVLDGDDWFPHEGVLKSLNAYYANPDVWMTYGRHVEYPCYEEGIARPLDMRKAVRQQPFVTSHLRTFYASLFKKVPLSAFQEEGHFFSVACDVASMLPMLELAGSHAYFVPEVLCIYNKGNPLSDHGLHLQEQMRVDTLVRACEPFHPLDVR